MSEGWFTSHALARKTAGPRLDQLAPFGISPELPGLAAARIGAEMHAQGWDSRDTALLLAAHGSARSKTSADAPLAFARALDVALSLRAVTVGFVV